MHVKLEKIKTAEMSASTMAREHSADWRCFYTELQNTTTLSIPRYNITASARSDDHQLKYRYVIYTNYLSQVDYHIQVNCLPWDNTASEGISSSARSTSRWLVAKLDTELIFVAATNHITLLSGDEWLSTVSALWSLVFHQRRCFNYAENRITCDT